MADGPAQEDVRLGQPGLVRSGYHHHRAAGVPGAVPAHRAVNQTANQMPAAGADDDQVTWLAGQADEGDCRIAGRRLERYGNVLGHPADCGREGIANQDRRGRALRGAGEAEYDMCDATDAGIRRPPCRGSPSAQDRTATNRAPYDLAMSVAVARAASPAGESSMPTITREIWPIVLPAAATGRCVSRVTAATSLKR